MEGAANTTFYSDLAQTCVLDNVTHFKRLLSTRPYDIDSDIDFSYFPLGSKEKFKVLKRTPLMIAAITNSSKVVEYIVGSGMADVDKASPSDGATAIDGAVDNGSSPTIIKTLQDAHDARVQMGQQIDFDQSRHRSVLKFMFNAPSMPQLAQEPIFLRPCYARDAAGERPSSFSDQVYQNINRSIQGSQEPNIPTPSDARDPAGERPSSSEDKAHQNMNHTMQGKQELNVPTPSDARDAAGERPSSSNDQVHQNMNHSMQGRQEPNIPTPSDARDPAGERPLSSDDQVDQNMNHSMQGRQEPNILTPSDARDPSGKRQLSSDDQVNQNMNHSMQGRQEPEVMINSSTPDPGIMNEFVPTSENAADWPPLMVGGKLVQPTRRR